ncbi:hypothetical protein RvY_10879 [Ramazzottius varieornatus]|uniref:SEA domain-containing protein n=1 Tax=Ramazzottius varieornatus TaxID=947166 RepID=A0A1D1VN61_RAMVA|nr:hypothetical protein RvY_10879 [Ramazzottius varieornatus]
MDDRLRIMIIFLLVVKNVITDTGAIAERSSPAFATTDVPLASSLNHDLNEHNPSGQVVTGSIHFFEGDAITTQSTPDLSRTALFSTAGTATTSRNTTPAVTSAALSTELFYSSSPTNDTLYKLDVPPTIRTLSPAERIAKDIVNKVRAASLFGVNLEYKEAQNADDAFRHVRWHVPPVNTTLFPAFPQTANSPPVSNSAANKNPNDPVPPENQRINREFHEPVFNSIPAVATITVDTNQSNNVQRGAIFSGTGTGSVSVNDHRTPIVVPKSTAHIVTGNRSLTPTNAQTAPKAKSLPLSPPVSRTTLTTHKQFHRSVPMDETISTSTLPFIESGGVTNPDLVDDSSELLNTSRPSHLLLSLNNTCDDIERSQDSTNDFVKAFEGHFASFLDIHPGRVRVWELTCGNIIVNLSVAWSHNLNFDTIATKLQDADFHFIWSGTVYRASELSSDDRSFLEPGLVLSRLEVGTAPNHVYQSFIYIIIGAIGAFVLLIIAVVIFIRYHRRRGRAFSVSGDSTPTKFGDAHDYTLTRLPRTTKLYLDDVERNPWAYTNPDFHGSLTSVAAPGKKSEYLNFINNGVIPMKDSSVNGSSKKDDVSSSITRTTDVSSIVPGQAKAFRPMKQTMFGETFKRLTQDDLRGPSSLGKTSMTNDSVRAIHKPPSALEIRTSSGWDSSHI